MPEWAQWLGELLPLTYFLRIVRGILLKGNEWPQVWSSLWRIGPQPARAEWTFY